MTTTNMSDKAPNGMVRVWDIERKGWRDVFTVDARELLRVNAVSLTAPDVRMKGLAGEVVVCASQVAEYESRGYAVVGEGGDGEGAGGGDGEGKDEDKGGGEPYAFDRHTVNELRAFAQRAGIEGATQLNKAALVDALVKSGWKPE